MAGTAGPGAGRRAPLLLGLLLLALGGPALAFKQEDFKRCDDAGFCKRMRGVENDWHVVDTSVKVVDGVLHADLHDPTPLKTKAKGPVAFVNADEPTLKVELLRTPGGSGAELVRVTIEEAGRYHVHGVLEDIQTARVPIAGFAEGSVKTGTFSSSKVFTVDMGNGLELALKAKPLLITVSEKATGEEVLVFNSKNNFHMERQMDTSMRHTRTGTDFDLWWGEPFGPFYDPKKRGGMGVSFDVKFPGYSNVYGIPQHASAFKLEATGGKEPFRLFNLDVFEYVLDNPAALYGSIPFMLGHKATAGGGSRSAGVFWLNAAEMFVDITEETVEVEGANVTSTETQWLAETGGVDAFLLLGPTPRDVTSQYAMLTGTTAMPQMFAIAYHQCRWNYNDDKDVAEVDGKFDTYNIPYDVLWLDIEHTDGKRYMTWDAAAFPTPDKMQNKLAKKGRNMVTIIDPHMKTDPGYHMYAAAQKAGHFVKDKEEKEYKGWCWPGESAYLDVMNPKVREFWAEQFLPENFKGSTPTLYTWNDMNEPSVFNGPEISMPRDNLHWSPGGLVEHREIHNTYGYFYHMGTAEGHKLRGLKANPDGDRPFVLSRAFFAGSQKLGPIWTGDNTADWGHLRASIPMLLSIGVTGLTFSGADVGGFFGNPDEELLVRWYQLGAFYPFFRAHAHLDTRRREPWLFSKDGTSRIGAAVRLRYTLLPYFYTLFREAATAGVPVMRPLWYEFPTQPDFFATEDAFMLGDALLVYPVMDRGATVLDVALPMGDGTLWYDYRTGEVFSDPAKSTFQVNTTMDYIPMYIKGGTIFARKETVRRSSHAMAQDPYTLTVAPDAAGKAKGKLYVDDGASYAHANKQEFIEVEFEFDGKKLSSKVVGGKGADKFDVPVGRIVFLGEVAGDLKEGPISIQTCWSLSKVKTIKQPDAVVGKDWNLEL